MIGLSRKQIGLVAIMFAIGGIVLANGISKITLAGTDISEDGIIIHSVIAGIIQGHNVTVSTDAQTTISEVRSIDGSIDRAIHDDAGEVIGNIHTAINLKTREAWTADNEIRYTITSTITGTDKVSDIFFVTVTNSSKTLEDSIGTNYNEFKNKYQEGGLIQLKNLNELEGFEGLEEAKKLVKEKGYKIWWRDGFFTMPLKGELAFYGGYAIEDKAHPMGTKKIVELESPSVKIQADAARALIKQVNESQKTNHIIEGLTWILVSVIPIGFALEIILREYYHNRKNQRM